MSNCWPTRVTSVAGSRPSSASAAKISYSLPKPQLPMFLPAKSAGVVIPLSAKLTCRVPERWKIWAMFTMSAPASRLASALGTHARAKSTSPFASWVCGTISTPPSTMVTSRHMRLVEAVVLRGEVAGELGLGEPLQLQADLVDGFTVAFGHRARRCVGAGRSVGAGRGVRAGRGLGAVGRVGRVAPGIVVAAAGGTDQCEGDETCRRHSDALLVHAVAPPGVRPRACWLVGLLGVAVWRTWRGRARRLARARRR